MRVAVSVAVLASAVDSRPAQAHNRGGWDVGELYAGSHPERC